MYVVGKSYVIRHTSYVTLHMYVADTGMYGVVESRAVIVFWDSYSKSEALSCNVKLEVLIEKRHRPEVIHQKGNSAIGIDQVLMKRAPWIPGVSWNSFRAKRRNFVSVSFLLSCPFFCVPARDEIFFLFVKIDMIIFLTPTQYLKSNKECAG